jgi:ABC-type Fe3+/spermidine/putrescine transport system ATPase subunit
VSPPAVSVRGLSVRLGERDVLADLSLEVEPGAHLLLVGRSGSGKTTLLRAIAGLARPSAGRVELFGAPVSEGARSLVPPERRGIGFLFQGGALWPHLSVERTLDFTLKLAGVERAERKRRTGELLGWMELEGSERRLPGTLSGGEAQRLALARALAVRPRLLLLDEPLGPLDAELRGSLLARLADVQRRFELTAIHVTHDPREAQALATRVLRMDQGRLQETGAESKAAPRVREPGGVA